MRKEARRLVGEVGISDEHRARVGWKDTGGKTAGAKYTGARGPADSWVFLGALPGRRL